MNSPDILCEWCIQPSDVDFDPKSDKISVATTTIKQTIPVKDDLFSTSTSTTVITIPVCQHHAEIHEKFTKDK